jgi:hypothetical protein
MRFRLRLGALVRDLASNRWRLSRAARIDVSEYMTTYFAGGEFGRRDNQ